MRKNWKRAKSACHPIFSPEDKELERMLWRADRDGYARASKNRYPICSTVILCHRMVLERMLRRKLKSSEWADHINGNRLDNRRENLRVTTPRISAQNKPGIKFRGTTQLPSGKWRAAVTHLGGFYYAGVHSTRESAAIAAAAKRDELGFLK